MTSKKFLIVMNKVTNMQVNTVKLLHRAGSVLLCAMALLALGSCRDDLQEPKEKTSEQTTQIPLENYIGKVDIALEATLEPMPDQEGRSLNFSLMDRAQRIGVDGKTVPAGTDYTDEVAPRMYLTEGSTVQGFLIFLHDGGEIVRESVAFKVIEGVKKANGTIVPTAKNRVQFVGNINFPAGFKLSDEFNKSSNDVVSGLYTNRISSENTTKKSGWHVMAMIGYQEATTYKPGGEDATAGTSQNRLLLGYSEDPQYRTSGSDSYAIAGGAGAGISLNTPCASAWMPLYITKTPGATDVTGINLELHFKPQGVILQYDLGGLSPDTQDIRWLGLVSNVLDFKGYYDLNAASIKAGYQSKDASGYGLPKWVPNPPSMDNLSMNYAPKADAPLSSGDRVFPWDMPTLSSSSSPKLANWENAGTHPWPVEQAAVLSMYPLGDNDPEETQKPTNYPWLTTKKLWTFYTMGGFDGSGSYHYSYKILYFWGMPRSTDRMPVTDKRATYLFASSHSLMTDEDAYDAGENGFDTKSYRDLIRKAVNTYNWLIGLKNDADAETDSEKKKDKQGTYEATKKYYETDEASNSYSAQFPGALFSALQPALQKARDLTQIARTSITPRTQPLMVLHQTNRTFPERKIYHAQAVIPQDLMLSEVIYQKHDGKNYSLLEVYNTSMEPIDLSKYAVVRLIPSADGSHLAFRDKDGQAVESLNHALVLPLTALKGETDPFAGSALTSLRQTEYSYDDPTKRALPIYYKINRQYGTVLEERWSGTYYYGKLVDTGGNHPDRSLYMLGGQSILLGGSGYVNTPVVNASLKTEVTELLDPNSWFKPLHELLKVNHDKLYLRYAYAYADGVKQTDGSFGEGTLDYRPGDAFALIKKTETGWQIVDATGPVGPKHLAFSGTYAKFKAEMANHSNAEHFSLQRLDGVNHPFIAPFRTKQLTSNWSDDWNILTDLTKFTPGRRFDYNGWKLSFPTFLSVIRRSPIDTQFTAYQNARPTKGH